MNQNIKVHSALFTVGVIYGANYSIAKIVTPEFVLPFGIIFLRVLLAGSLFWVFHSLRVKEKVQSKRDYLHLAVCGFFGVASNQLMFFKGLSITTPINAALIMTTTPILVLVASSILIKERITWIKVLGIILGCFGAVHLIAGDGFSFQSENMTGDLFIFLNATSYGIYLVLVKPLMKKYQALTVMKWTFIYGFIVVIPFGISEVINTPWSALPAYVYLSLAFIIIGTTFFAYLLNAWALQFVNSTVVGFYIYLQPVLATFFAILMGKDMLRWDVALSTLLIFTGVFLVSYVRKRD